MERKTGIILGAVALGAALLLTRKVTAKGTKKPGDKVSARIAFNHQGPARIVWIGFGLGGGHQDPVTMDGARWIGRWVEVPGDNEKRTRFVNVEGTFPSDLPGGMIDANKIIHVEPPPYTGESYSHKLSDDWDDEVYKAGQ